MASKNTKSSKCMNALEVGLSVVRFSALSDSQLLQHQERARTVIAADAATIVLKMRGLAPYSFDESKIFDAVRKRMCAAIEKARTVQRADKLDLLLRRLSPKSILR